VEKKCGRKSIGHHSEDVGKEGRSGLKYM